MESTETLSIENRADTERQSATGVLFAVTIFLSAFLLFQVQLLISKYLLPWFGGAPAVWTTCMLFFQLLLLAGYFYAHRISARISLRRQAQIQIAILAVTVLVMLVLALKWGSPITPGTNWRPQDSAQPIRDLLILLTACLALPFFLLATTSPLLQRWLANTGKGGETSGVYRLYAVSNLGSLLGLVSYPFLIEPYLRLMTQARMWSAGFVAYAVLAGICAWRVRGNVMETSIESATTVETAVPTSASTKLLWFGLSMCGSLLLLSTTSLVSEDMGVVPLLWVLPLTLYLLTFILCFSGWPIYRRVIFLPALVLVLTMATMAVFRGVYLPAVIQIYVYCFTLFVICMVCHGELARLTPPVSHLTGFYLIMAMGGAAGGILNGVVAPVIFRGFWEYHLSLLMSSLLVLWIMLRADDPFFRRAQPWLPVVLLWMVCLLPRYVVKANWARLSGPLVQWLEWLTYLLPVTVGVLAVMQWKGKTESRGWLWFTRAGVMLSAAFLAYMLFLETTIQRGTVVMQSRNFYGVLRVRERNPGTEELHYYELTHGRIMHGLQLRAPKYRHTLTSYYTRGSGLGMAILNHPYRNLSSIRIGAVGMGVGTAASYVRPGDLIRFYEINPQVMKMDLGENAIFTYLNDCKGRFEIVRGDARLSMERELEENRPQKYDILILDAFSSDAIPVHLLTLQAMEMYMKHLRDEESVIAVHISNRAIDLRPVVAGIASRLKLKAVLVENSGLGETLSASEWIILSRSSNTLGTEPFQRYGMPMVNNANAPLWTDDYSNLFHLMK